MHSNLLYKNYFELFVSIFLISKHQSAYRGQKYLKKCTCPAGRLTYNFHSSCKHMHMSFKSVCNKEQKGVICNMTSSSNSSQSTRPVGQVLGKNYLSFLDFTCNYKRTSGICVPWHTCHTIFKFFQMFFSLFRCLPLSENSLNTFPNMWNTIILLVSAHPSLGLNTGYICRISSTNIAEINRGSFCLIWFFTSQSTIF